jgi:hypothetical protein
MILHVYLEDAIDHFDPYVVADVKVCGADGYGFFAALTQVKIDSAGDIDAMKTLGRAFLGILVIDHFPLLGNGGE